MAKITDLPVELLQNIVLLIDGSALDFTRVCWKFNQVATPILYRSIRLENPGICCPSLLNAIIHRPRLGEHVRSVHIAMPAIFPARLEYHEDPDPNDILIWAATAASYGLPQEVQQAIENGSTSAMLFLMLFYLPALHELSIFGLPYIGQKILHANPLPLGLQSVRCVGISFPNDFLSFIPFLSLPALKTLMVWNAGFGEIRPDNTTHLLPCSSNVERIKLSHCVISDNRLEMLVRSSRSLRALSLERPSVALSKRVFHAPTLGNALRECALSTLERLELDFSPIGTFKHTQSLGPLSDFVHLTHIWAPLSSLLDYPSKEGGVAAARRLSKSLPQSLTSLIVFLDGYWASEYWIMKAFVEVKHERLVHLNALTILEDFPNAELMEIELACEAERVEFRTDLIGWLIDSE